MSAKKPTKPTKPTKPRKARYETHPTDLNELFRAQESLLRAKLGAARAGLSSHLGELGANLEVVTRTFLRSFLPHEYGLGRGFVIWRDKDSARPSVSSQLDIIIYDAVRGGPIADLETSQVYAMEHVYGYVEVKTVFTDHLDTSLAVSHRLRTPCLACYQGRPWDLFPYLPSTEQQKMVERFGGIERPPNTVGAIRMPRGRLLCWMVAFEGSRTKKHATPEGLRAYFEQKWLPSREHSHLTGALILDVRSENPTREAVFLGSVAAHGAARRSFVSNESAAIEFSKMMLLNLSAFERMPTGLSVNYHQYLNPPPILQP